MPTYTFRNDETTEEFDILMSMAEREKYVQDNPHLTQIHRKAPALGDPIRLGVRKPDDSFRDVLKNVKHHHKKDNINTW